MAQFRASWSVVRPVCVALCAVFLLTGCPGGSSGGGSSAPEAEIVSKPNPLTNSSDASFALASNQTGSTFQCQLDGGGYSDCTTPKNYAGLGDGDHTFCATATNDSGQTSSAACYTWTIDTVAPETTLTSTPTKPIPSDAPDFGFTSSEADSTFTCVLDGGTPDTTCTSPHGYTGIPDGSHEFCVAATDPAGNTDPTPACHDWDTDVTPPSISGAADVIEEATGPAGAVATFASPAATDAIGPVTVACAPASGGTFALGTQSVTCTATDDAGNTANTSFDVTVRDTTDPSLSVPSDATVEAPGDTTPVSTGTATATDIVDTAPAVTFADAEVAGTGQVLKTITRTWTATDASGNSTSADQTITVVDTTAPALTVPADTTVEAPGDTTPSGTGAASATDDVDAGPSVTFTDAEAAGTGQLLKTITRTWTATDASGNSASADQTITVMDTTPPDLTVPADVTVGETDDTSPAATGTATATDAVDAAPVVDFSDAEVAGTGQIVKVITRTWTATDASGNSASADQTITVAAGNTAPAPTAPDIAVFAGATGTSQVDPGDPDTGQTHAYAIVTAPLHGSASVDAGGLVTYTADVGYSGPDSVEVEVTDDGVPPLSGAVVIGVTVSIPPTPITLTITANPDPVAPGDPIHYEVRVANVGSTTQANVVLTVVTPNNGLLPRAQITGGATCTLTTCSPGQLITWPTWTLAPGQVETVTFAHNVAGGGNAPPDGTLVHLDASVAFAGGTVTGSHDVEVQSAPGLQLALNEDLDPVAPGGQLTYTIDLTNTAAAALPLAQDAVLVATIPAGATFVSASATGTEVAGTVRWNIGFVDAGAARRFTFTVAVDTGAETGDVLSAQAQVFSGGTLSMVRALASTIVRDAEPLTLAVVANPDPVRPGDPVHYEVRVANVGTTTLSNVVLTVVTPNNGLLPRAQITGGATCALTTCSPGQLITWPTWTLAPGQVETVTFAHNVTGGGNAPPDGTLVHLDARVTHTGGDLSLGRDVVVKDADGLRLAMNEDLDPVAPGGQLTYTIDLTNTAAAALPLAQDGTLAVTLPAGTTFAFSTTGGGALVGREVQWAFGFVDAGAAKRYTFTVNVDAAAQTGDVLTSLARVVVSGDQPVVAATSSTIVRDAEPLTLAVVANPDPVRPGDPVHYEVRVANVGTTTLSNVVLTVVTPNNGLLPRAQITGGATCALTTCSPGQLITWPTWTLAPGQVETVTFTHNVTGGGNAPPVGTLIHLDARVDYNGGDLSLGRDVAVKDADGLRLAMNEDLDPVAPGGQLTYTIDLTNTASAALPATLDGILAAAIPAGTTFVSAGGGGTQVGSEVQWNTGFVDAGAAERYTFTVGVDAAAQDGDVLASRAEVVRIGAGGRQPLVTATASTIVRDGEPITLAVTATPDPVLAGSGISYTVDVTNTGATTLANVVLTVVTPNNGLLPRAQITGGATCALTTCSPGQLITWPTWTLAPGQVETVTFTHNVTGGGNAPPVGTLIHLDARVNYVGHDVSLARDVVVGP